jgi:hypothetical protein
MRTTVTLDDDVAGLLKQRARELGTPFKQAVNRTIRAGIGEASATRRHPAPKTISHSFGFRPGIDLDKHGQLANALEAEALVGRLSLAQRRHWPSYLGEETDSEQWTIAGIQFAARRDNLVSIVSSSKS